MRTLLIVAGVTLLGALPGFAQVPRFELGVRVIALENTWQATPADTARLRALPHVQEAVGAFFALRPDLAARAMDEARRSLLSAEPADADVRWADALTVRPQRFLVDASETLLVFEAALFYPVDGMLPADVRVEVDVAGVKRPLTVSATHSGPLRLEIPWGTPTSSDVPYTVRVTRGERTLRVFSAAISMVKDLEARRRQLAAHARGLPAGNVTETLGLTLEHLEYLAAGGVPEGQARAAELLARSEFTVNAPDSALPRLAPVAGDHWLRLTSTGGPITLRLQVPTEKAPAAGYPLVVAIHGAGGSEHLFFEGYGCGRAKKLAEDRHWLLVAPRVGPFGRVTAEGVVDAVAGIAPVDRRRVFVVGHSMGAVQTLAALARSPGTFRAAAAVSGGYSLRGEPAAYRTTPVFVAAGDRDFGLRGAARVKEYLEHIGHPEVTYRVYPNCEHLLVMGESLPDVFEFFDAALAGSAEDR